MRTTTDITSPSGRINEQREPAWSKVKAWDHFLRNYNGVAKATLTCLLWTFTSGFLDDRYDLIIGRDCRIFHQVKGNTSDADALGVAFNPGSF